MIQFYRGLKSKYTYPTNSSLQDALFFATDTGELLLNGVNYGIDNEKIKNVSFDTSTNKLIFTKADDSVIEVNFGDKLLSDEDRAAVDNLKEALEGAGFTANYETDLDPNLATVSALGGIPQGTKVSVYKGKPLSKIIDDLLFPTIQPTAVEPSVSLSLKSGVANIREVGSSSPIASNFTTVWNPGSIKIGTIVKSNRAGEKVSDVLYAGTESNVVGSTPGTVTVGTTNYYYKVNYNEGPQPLDSKGNPATSLVKLPAGSKVSGAVAVYGVYPFYANTTATNITEGTFTKLTLTNSTTFTQKLPAENPSKHTFKLPHNVTKIEFENPLKANDWQVMNLSTQWSKTTENIDVNGTNVSYNVYTRCDAGFVGGFNYRVTYTK